MTEAEAKTKWCPMVRASLHAVNTVVGTNDTLGASVRCIGSACMMWRHSGPILDAASLLAASPANRRQMLIERASHEQANGYCGLAGKP